MEILKVASGRSGLDKIESGSCDIVNGKISFQLFICIRLLFLAFELIDIS